MIELEKTYLAKKLPKNLQESQSKEIIDIYFPKTSDDPQIRLRQNGDKFELTKKMPLSSDDASCQEEQTIILTKREFDDLASQIDGKRVRKIRYFYKHEGRVAEFDVFQDDLQGLVVIDFEFDNEKEKEKFVMPDFCLVDITQEKFIAGGMICGKSYENILPSLEELGYNRLFLS